MTTASASVSTSGDKATITLTGDGEFECMLDDGPFMTCKYLLVSVPAYGIFKI